MMNPEEQALVNWMPISEEYLFDRFGSEERRTAVKSDMFEVDPSKVHFMHTPYDRYYYKAQFPKLDDNVCELLERCSLNKMNLLEHDFMKPIEEEPATPKNNKNTFSAKQGNFIIDFN
jgi:hypothetical protein